MYRKSNDLSESTKPSPRHSIPAPVGSADISARPWNPMAESMELLDELIERNDA
jgi:hypothetical protein